MSKHTDSKRDLIVQTAAAIVMDVGVGQLTLDAVAQRAGISKGGMLYHFATKNALIVAMLEAYIVAFEASITQFMALDSNPRGRWLRAYVHATFTDSVPEVSLAAAGLAALATNPELLDRLRNQWSLWMTHALADGVPPATARIVVAATDGAWFTQMVGSALEDNTTLRDALLALIDDQT